MNKILSNNGQKELDLGRIRKSREKHKDTKMSRQNAEEEKSAQPASKIVRGRQKIHPAVEITSWQSWQKALHTKKLIQALRGSQHAKEEPKSSGTSGESSFKRREERLCATSTITGMSWFSSSYSVLQCRGHTSLPYWRKRRTVQSNTITPTRSPAGSKMDLCWVTATRSQTANQSRKTPHNLIKLHSILAAIQKNSLEFNGGSTFFAIHRVQNSHRMWSAEGKEYGKA